MFSFLANPALAWPLVIAATVVETLWFVVLKKAGGEESWSWTILGYLMVFIDIPLLNAALKTLPAGTVYAFWTGASAVAITLLGISLFNEPATPLRLLFIGLIVLGLLGITFTS